MNREYESRSKFVGTMSAAGFVVFAFLFCSYSSVSVNALHNETEILVEPEDEIAPPPEPQKIEVAAGIEPRSTEPKPQEPVKLVQKSESATVAKRENVSEEATVGDKGDVEVPEPPREKEINKRALFSSAHNSDKDTLAAQAAEKVTEALKAGHSDGNTKNGNPEGTPSAKLAGRTIMGSLPLPAYNIQKEGRVVVQILVNQDGKVFKAVPGAKGTTVTDQALWQAAKHAALKAQFNVSRDAPESQEGTITYVFKLN